MCVGQAINLRIVGYQQPSVQVGLTPPLSLTPSVSLSDDQNDNFIGLSRTIEECKTGM